MEVLVAGAAVLAVLLDAGWWVARAPRGPRAVLGIAVDVLTGAFLLRPAPARTTRPTTRPTPRRTRPNRPPGKARDVTAPAPVEVGLHARTPVPGQAAAVRSSRAGDHTPVT